MNFCKSTFSILLLLTKLFCLSANDIMSGFPGKQPGTAQIRLAGNSFTLHNDVLSATFKADDSGVLVFDKFVNKLEGRMTFSNDGFPLYKVKMSDGTEYTNSDFIIVGNLSCDRMEPTDSLPRPALKFAGYCLHGNFICPDAGLAISWKAELRDQSNYIRQSIRLSATDGKDKNISEVHFFDRVLKGARYMGSVLGSPILCDRTFFGMEHPIAHSRAFRIQRLGGINGDNVDVTGFIKGNGSYVIGIEHLANSIEYDVTAVVLKKNGKIYLRHDQKLNSPGGGHLYEFNIEDYDVSAHYSIEAEVSNPDKASVSMYIYKTDDDILNFYTERNGTMRSDRSISESSVVGVVPHGQLRRGFQYYIDRERARAYKQFLHYNSWWDIAFYNETNSEDVLSTIQAWNEKFIKPYGVHLDSFVIDDGWDDLDHIWYFNKTNFPEGFTPHAALTKEIGSGIGVWMSPFGGYFAKHDHRVKTAEREGLECNTAGMSLAGKNYWNRFYQRSAVMLEDCNVNYFKYDGFGGSDPRYLPDMEGGMRLISEVRKINPDVYINITVGSWPSPFWLRYSDCTWRGSGDMFLSGVGNSSQKVLTFRDGILHNSVVSRAPLYPLNSIMTCGIALAKHGEPANWVSGDSEDFKDMVRSYFAGGSSLQELYISHERMTDELWGILAESAKWAKANENVLVDTHWIGGSPINLEVYGWASWNGDKGIICLRNPNKITQEFDMNLKKILELRNQENGRFELISPWKEDSDLPPIKVNSRRSKKIILGPFDVLVREVYKR